ncbi:YadA-like family protein [Paraburkholderia domus]|uniref:YadA-like family protein n=1 Tax=Paraburkholderia domus TaxID=2793075 RepID=UPI0019141C0C|nr:YadA-like family protein [Paraburkholderia domus]MBK5048742.1 YadA-like family protein [Burkholderia sp. R-70006]MBK5065456.1 YadA-like family protein [Burkholderia sp. R-70199]MBK5090482.1 YadA-like family protein [Burkholderia sp. R-69927]MBK5120130.1 YadA-like family protein [Burkholderia sp. R-69980]MBK5165574.1 YadA-like family protein [Burkholderia sp. R-70211]MBK5184782.1 YadA-like family protein [Burkholderia sp. R-69749]
MLNKTYKTVWNGTSRTYVAASEVTKSRGAKGAAACGALRAAGAGMLGVLAFSLPAGAAECEASNGDCVTVHGTSHLAPALNSSALNKPLNAIMNAPGGSDSALQAALQPLAATTANSSKLLSAGDAAPADDASVTQYIAVSPVITPGLTTTALYGENAMAVGVGATALGDGSLAVGASSGASRNATTAVGSGAAALALNSTVVGAGATTNSFADNGVAIGYLARVQNANALAIGTNVQTNAEDSIAAGSNAFIATAATKAIAFGSGASVSAVGSVALGADSTADRSNVVSVGSSTLQRQIINVAAGTQNNDVVNISQLKGAMAAIGGGAAVASDGMITRPAYTIGGKTYNDVGSALSALAVTGEAATADAVQYDSSAHDAVTLGNTGTPVRITNLRAGALAADSSDAVNGSQLFATNQAVAQNTSDIAANTSSITNLDARTTTIEGDVSNITNQITNGEIGLVQQDQVTRNLTVAKDVDGASVDFTGTSGARELTGIAAGTADTSAANVGQLKPMVAALGGGAQINADGTVTGPTYHMQGGTQTTVSDALGSLDSGLTTLQQNMATGGIGIVTQDPVSRIINVGATTDGSLINVAGTAGNRVLTGVAPGAVNAASTDAINGSQLYAHAASTAVALGGGSTVNPDGSVTAPSYTVGGTVVNNVGSAITNLDGRVTQNTSDIAGLQTTVNNISGSVANAVQYDSSAHDKVTLGGTAAGASKVTLTNLQDGEVSATSTDAVTGAQLWNTNQQIGNLGQQIGDLGQAVKNTQVTGSSYVAVNSTGNAAQAIGNGTVAIGGGAKASAPNSVAIGEGSVADQSNTVSVGSAGNERRITNVAAGQAPTDAVNMQQFQGGMNEIARNAYSGTASAIALTMVPEVDANKNLAIGVGTAGYKGYQAVAVGLSARVTQSIKVKLGAGISSATTTVGAGAAYQW